MSSQITKKVKISTFCEQDKELLPLTNQENEKKYGQSLAVFQNVFFQLQHEKPLKDDVMRLLILLSPKVRLMDEIPSEQTIFSLKAKEYAAVTGLSVKGAYTALDRAVSSLYEHSVIYHDKNRGLVRTRLVTSAAYMDGMFTVSFSHFALHIMRVFNTSFPFTKIQISHMAKLSGHALKIYPFLIQNSFRANILVSISELKSLLSIDNESYQDYKDFKKQVLKPHIDQINSHTDLSVSFLAEKHESKKASHVRFSISKKIDVKEGGAETNNKTKNDEKQENQEIAKSKAIIFVTQAIRTRNLYDRFRNGNERDSDILKRITSEMQNGNYEYWENKLKEYTYSIPLDLQLQGFNKIN